MTCTVNFVAKLSDLLYCPTFNIVQTNLVILYISRTSLQHILYSQENSFHVSFIKILLVKVPPNINRALDL